MIIRGAAALDTLAYIRETTNNKLIGQIVERRIVTQALDDLSFQTNLYEIECELGKKKE